MRAYMLVLLLCLVSAACGNVASKIDAAVPLDSAIDAPPACAIGTTALCSGNDLVICDGQGHITSMTTCAVGCNAGAMRCNKVDPSNGLAAHLDAAETAPDLVLVGAATIDTDAATI